MYKIIHWRACNSPSHPPHTPVQYHFTRNSSHFQLFIISKFYSSTAGLSGWYEFLWQHDNQEKNWSLLRLNWCLVWKKGFICRCFVQGECFLLKEVYFFSPPPAQIYVFRLFTCPVLWVEKFAVLKTPGCTVSILIYVCGNNSSQVLFGPKMNHQVIRNVGNHDCKKWYRTVVAVTVCMFGWIKSELCCTGLSVVLKNVAFVLALLFLS